MAKFNLISKKIAMERKDIIKFQLLTHFFVNRVPMSESEISCLSLLGLTGESELADFCNLVVEKGVFKTSQTVRNFLTRAEKMNIVVKNGKSRKSILLNPELNIESRGNILVDLKAFYVNNGS